MYLIFNNEEKFNIWHEEVNKHFGYPNEETKTQQYTKAVSNEVDDRIIAYRDKKVPSQLLEGHTQKTYEECLSEKLLIEYEEF